MPREAICLLICHQVHIRGPLDDPFNRRVKPEEEEPACSAFRRRKCHVLDKAMGKYLPLPLVKYLTKRE